MCNLLAVDGVHDPGVASINAGKSFHSMLLVLCFSSFCESASCFAVMCISSIFVLHLFFYPSMLWCCWLDYKKGIWPVKLAVTAVPTSLL